MFYSCLLLKPTCCCQKGSYPPHEHKPKVSCPLMLSCLRNMVMMTGMNYLASHSFIDDDPASELQ